MYTVIEASNGTTLMEEYTPLPFTGTVGSTFGSTYTVTLADLGNKKFDHWDNGVTDRTRTIVLGQEDATITAYLEIDSTADDDTTTDSQTVIIQRFSDSVNQDDCFDVEDVRRLNMAIGDMIRNIFSESEGSGNCYNRR